MLSKKNKGRNPFLPLIFEANLGEKENPTKRSTSNDRFNFE